MWLQSTGWGWLMNVTAVNRLGLTDECDCSQQAGADWWMWLHWVSVGWRRLIAYGCPLAETMLQASLSSILFPNSAITGYNIDRLHLVTVSTGHNWLWYWQAITGYILTGHNWLRYWQAITGYILTGHNWLRYWQAMSGYFPPFHAFDFWD